MPNSTESNKILNDIDEFVKNANIEQAKQYLIDYIRLNGYIGETIIYPSADLDATVI